MTMMSFSHDRRSSSRSNPHCDELAPLSSIAGGAGEQSVAATRDYSLALMTNSPSIAATRDQALTCSCADATLRRNTNKYLAMMDGTYLRVGRDAGV